MLLNTARFGSIEIDPERIINFPEGIPGLEQLKKFILLTPENLEPLQCLQSIEDGDITFIIASPFVFKPDYVVDLPAELLKLLDISSQEEVAVFSILNIPEDYKKMTANLMAPIIINTNKLLGKQIIIEKGDYSIRYKIFETPELVIQEGGRD